MNTALKNKITVLLMGGLLLLLSLVCWFKPASTYSDSERRVLAAFPTLNKETVLSGEFMTDFETYTLDQFPMRDTFRSVKGMATLYLFQQAQVNGLYRKDGYIAKAEYPLSQPMLENAGQKFQALYDTYMADTNVNLYFSIVPDKNYFLASGTTQLSMDYDTLVETMRAQTPYMKYVDLFPALSIEDYYYTDTHWKQEELLPIAQILADAMGAELHTDYNINTLTDEFYGVYYGQLALPVRPDSLKYLTNDLLDACIVTNYDTGKPVSGQIYDFSKVDSKDPYEMYVCGNSALVTIENPLASTDKELIVFRDSFTSSLAPLLAGGYRKITLVDIRYMQSGMLGYFLKFDNQDVLFLYSTLVLNSSTSFK